MLSQGNFDSVHHLLPDKTEAVIFAHTDDLVEHTRNGSVDASLISGLPEDEKGLVTFSSTLVSPRAMFSAEPADTLRLLSSCGFTSAVESLLIVSFLFQVHLNVLVSPHFMHSVC